MCVRGCSSLSVSLTAQFAADTKIQNERIFQRVDTYACSRASERLTLAERVREKREGGENKFQALHKPRVTTVIRTRDVIVNRYLFVLAYKINTIKSASFWYFTIPKVYHMRKEVYLFFFDVYLLFSFWFLWFFLGEQFHLTAFECGRAAWDITFFG